MIENKIILDLTRGDIEEITSLVRKHDKCFHLSSEHFIKKKRKECTMRVVC